MTKDELAKALEEYPEKLREALLRQYEASLKLDEARVDLGVSQYMHVDGDFSVKRAKIEHNIRTDPSKYGLSPRPSNAAIQTALLASDEYAQLISTRNELQDNDTDTRDASILKARADKELADIEVEVLQRTLETYRILADIIT